MSRSVQIVVGVVAALVLAGAGFAAGMTAAGGQVKVRTGPGAAPSPSGERRVFLSGPGGAAGTAAERRTIAGKVVSVGDGSITIELGQAGSGQARSTIVLVGPGARVVRTTETPISASDIKVGDDVIVAGQPDATTGAVSASAVMVGADVLQELFGGARGGPPQRGASPPATKQP